jgi:hypothetical protein
MYTPLGTALAAVSLALPAHAATLPVAPITIELAQCFAADPTAVPVGAGGAPVRCSGFSTAQTTAPRCAIHGDDDTTATVAAASRNCTVYLAFLELIQLCATDVRAEVWLYGPGGEFIQADFAGTLAGGHGPVTTLGFSRTDRYGRQTVSLVGGGTFDLRTQSGNPCVVGNQVQVTLTLTGLFGL